VLNLGANTAGGLIANEAIHWLAFCWTQSVEMLPTACRSQLLLLFAAATGFAKVCDQCLRQSFSALLAQIRSNTFVVVRTEGSGVELS